MLLANLPCFPLTLNFFFFVVVLFNFVIVVIALDVSERKWAERKTPGEEKGNETNKQMQTLKGEQDEGREGWWGGDEKREVFCLCFFVFQCLGSVLCGEIHCRLLTRCFFIFSVWPSFVCLSVYAVKQEVETLWAGKWRVVERLVERSWGRRGGGADRCEDF